MPAAPEAAGAKGAGVSLGDMYATCVQMVNENKISTKNAFDLHLIDRMDDIVESFMCSRKSTKRNADGSERKSVGGSEKRQSSSSQDEVEENRFHEASCTIEASAKIYACRVDCVHTDTYRLLGGVNSADMGDEEEGGGEDGKPGEKKRRRIVGVNTLERNENNITQNHIEADEMSDPMFRRMAAAFDAGGAKGLLLGHLPIAEDLSLVFNGDVPVSRAVGEGDSLFSAPMPLLPGEMGIGKDPAAFRAKLQGVQLCPDLDQFRREMYGKDADLRVSLPQEIQRLLQPVAPAPAGAAAPLPLGAPDTLQPLQEVPAGADDSDMPGDLPGDMPGDMPDEGRIVAFEQPGPPQALGPDTSIPDPFGSADGGMAIVSEIDGAIGSVEARSSDVIAFDELFEKFCSTGGKHQFAYFDDCFSKVGKDAKGSDMGVLTDGYVGGGQVVLDARGQPGSKPEAREKAPKKPLFDLATLDQPPRPIETEAAHKHQLSERAAQWQLHKDVPPYMIDRITMPSWPTWSKCDFACLGLRPHLMLKLVKKQAPEEEGPHGFSDLFSTVVVENSDVLPWLSGARRGPGMADDADRVVAPADSAVFDNAGGEDDFDGSGLPAHLDVDPQELFLRPEDNVIPSAECGDLDEGGEDVDGDDAAGYTPGIDFELVEQPAVVGNTEIGYSRNSKFVDVKLVKKHLWECIEGDIEDANAAKHSKAASSFQNLVSRTVRKMPRSECENLSVAVCFICALHLCNEKNLELHTQEAKPLGDFAVVGETAVAKSA